MNAVYRVVWNASKGLWVAVSELTRRRQQKPTRRLKTLAAAVALGGGLVAVPARAQTVIDGGTVVTVPGTFSSPWNAGIDLTVGTTSLGGTLNIQNGGQVTSVVGSTAAGHVANGANSVGVVSVTGPGSIWSMDGELHLAEGDGSHATLNILDGGVIRTTGSSGGIRMGYGTGVADVTVDGNGSLLSSPASLDVGETGRSTLTVSNGGRANANSIRVGFGVGASGVVNIGAAAGSAPVAPGTLGTSSVVLSAGLNSLLVLNHSDVSGSYVLSPVISGTGQIRVYNGTTVVTGNNSYTGGTVFNGGALQVASDANLGGAAGGLTFNGGTLRTTASFGMARGTTLNAAGGTLETQAGVLTHSGLIAGAGALTKTGAGTLVLTGNNVFTGGTSVAAGILQLGNGGTTGTLGTGAIAVASGAILAFDRSDAYEVPGSGLSVAGTLSQRGTGSTAFVGNTLAGGVEVLAGTFNFGQSLTSNTLLLGNGTLNVNSDFNRAVAPVVVSSVAGTDSTLTVGGILRANGDLGDGNDAMTVRGWLDIGAGNLSLGSGNDQLTIGRAVPGDDLHGSLSGSGIIDLGSGDDVVTLNLDAPSVPASPGESTPGGLGGFTGLLDGGTSSAGNALLINTSGASTFGQSVTLDGGRVANFDSLQKGGPGTLTLTGAHTYRSGTVDSEAGLVVGPGGSLTTPSVELFSGSNLVVQGTVQSAGGAPALIVGDAGANQVDVFPGGTLHATGNLNDGIDSLTVEGALDLSGGTFSLGPGDDSFSVVNATQINGTVDGGAGDDGVFVHVDTGSLRFGVLPNFEDLTKSGAGTMQISGASGNFDLVYVSEGALDITATGSATSQFTLVNPGATLNVDGALNGVPGLSNTLYVDGGTVSGTGPINLGNDDDFLYLFDGAILDNTVDGGAHLPGGGDTVIINNLNPLTVDGARVANFEKLEKSGAGIAYLTGAHSYTSGSLLFAGTLSVDGMLTTPTLAMSDDTTLEVAGTMAAGALSATVPPTAITGSAGVNTVRVNAGGTLYGTGDLGDGADVLDIAGTLDIGGGTLSLGSGDDTFTVYDTTRVLNGTVDGGAGNDMLNVVVSAGNVVPFGGLMNFESLGKSGPGTMQINGDSGIFITVDAHGGVLEVTPGATAVAQQTVVDAGATLQVDGFYNGTTGDDTMTVAGALTGAGNVNLADGNDRFELQGGGTIAPTTSVDGGNGTDTLVLGGTGTGSFDASRLDHGIDRFEDLRKEGTSTWTLTGTGAPNQAWTIAQGTLVGDTQSLQGDIANQAELVFDQAAYGTYAGSLSGTGNVTKTGSGAVVINSVVDYTGVTHVAAGTLAVGDSKHLSAAITGKGGVNVDAGAFFGGYGEVVGNVNNAGTLGVGNALPALANGPDADFAIVGDLVNTGTVSLVNGAAGDHLNVAGTYVSSGGRLETEAVLNAGDTMAQSDRLIANAVALAGSPTGIVVHNLGGAGAVTSGDGIPLVTVLDPSASAAGAFVLASRAVAGPYEYRLFQGGVIGANNGQWYLRSEAEPTPPTETPPPTEPVPPTLVPIFRPEIGAYLANREASTGLLVQSLHDRLGDPQFSRDGSTSADGAMGKMWLRVLGGNTRLDAAGGAIDARGGRSLFQIGGDVGNWNLVGANDQLHVGGMLGRANTNADASAELNPARAHGHTDGYLAGAYATWFANNDQRLGSYVDAWAQYGWFDNEVRSDFLPTVDYNARSWAVSLEYGYGFGIGQHWVIEPQTQIVYTDYRADRITDSSGTRIRSNDGGNTLGRLGVRVYPQLMASYAIHPFVEANWWHGGGRNEVTLNGIAVADDVPSNRYQTNVGFQGRMGGGWVMWARMGYEWGNNHYQRPEGQIGVKLSW